MLPIRGRRKKHGGSGNEGREGFCLSCQKWMGRREPDACLGFLPGVAHACCGHGSSDPITGGAYCVFGDAPDEGVYEMKEVAVLWGDAATHYFRSLGLSVPDNARAAA